MNDPHVDRELEKIFGAAQFKFWVCPVEKHRDRRDTQDNPVVTVQWFEDVAVCTAYRCPHTSAGRRILNVNPPVTRSAEWPDDTFVQGGRSGLVIRRNPTPDQAPTYTTAFVEACDDAAGFIRGEGDTLEAAEVDALTKYRAALECPALAKTGDHRWNARGYTNGGAFCDDCNRFGSQVYTAEQLGLYCAICDLPANYQQINPGEGQPLVCLCEEHELPSMSDVQNARWRLTGDMDPHFNALLDRFAGRFTDEQIANWVDVDDDIPFREAAAAVKAKNLAYISSVKEGTL